VCEDATEEPIPAATSAKAPAIAGVGRKLRRPRRVAARLPLDR
jgi:hypothetical protein